MRREALRDAEKYKKVHQRKKRWRRGVTGLACVVVFCTVYALILPAITLEKTGCEIPEHIHSEACYTQITSATRTEPVCTIESLNLHHHGDTCYDSEGNLTCRYADFVVHRHDLACFDENGNLWCPLPEILEHTHSDSCYAIPETGEVHTHTDDCYTVERGELICTEHVHADSCYTEQAVLTCSQEESEGHQHDESCQDENGEILCGIEPFEGHHHGDSCYEILRERICGVDSDHQHSDDCYAWDSVTICDLPTEPAEVAAEPAEPVLICEKPEVILHTHELYVNQEQPGCYDEYGNLICGQIQILEHQHTDACFGTVTEPVDTTSLICTIPADENHTHGPLCYGTWELTCTLEEHTHSEACTPTEPVYYCGKEAHAHSETCYDEAGALTCGLEEHTHSEACMSAEPVYLCGAEAHTHSEACYTNAGALICGMEEHTHSGECTVPEKTTYCGKEAHTHSEACYTNAGALTCGMEEHTHSLACYSDPTGDVETAEIWEQTFAGVTLTGNWRQDAVSIAQTQLGYTESTMNYMVAEDGETVKGYTRYGAWYGDPYAGWNTMFLSFCLHYAGVEDVPMDANCGSLVTAWADGFVPAQSHEAAAGDLVFFDRDGDGTADHAGLVTEVTDSGFTAIEGDVEGAVRLLSYGADDPMILGYVNLPEGAKEFTLTAQTETGITVTITGDSASLPYPAREITVTVKEVTDEESIAIRDQLLGEEAAEPERSFLLDITLWHGEEEIEPTGPVTVAFGGFDTEGLYPKVYHIDTEANEATDMDAVKDEAGDITVSTDHFSLYDVQFLSAPEGTPISSENITQIANGGTYYLPGVVYTSSTINITGDTVLDLNGYGVYYSGTSEFLVVNSGATLTIKDSNPASVSESNGSGNLYGNVASLESDGNKPVKLTYYVTQSSASGTGTSETLKKYEVTPTGCIVGEAGGGAASIVRVNSGGTCNLEGGLLTIKNSSSYGGDAHIISNSGTLNLSGGYVAGGKDACWGGGIFSENGAVNMSGGVIADNYGTNGGGLCVKDGSFTMTGGVISGNGTHSANVTTGSWDRGLGGGVFAKNATVRIEGGYITNNSEYGKCGQDGFGCHGGGGIATTGGTLTMTGGFVTGNYSQEAGGGMYVGHYNLGGTSFSMSGGIVAGNVAQHSEGGGIRISGQTTGVINASGGKLYITNNHTNSTYDWGGGGIFVQEKGTLNIYNSLITSNSAGGFGGGFGACPTGETLIVHNDGAAIYGNKANGTTMSGGGNGKVYDIEAQNDPNFMYDKRFQDYFCVKAVNDGNYIALITGEMVGGGAANWKGSCDGQKIEISKTGHAAAKYRFGLTAYPDSSAISSAQTAAGVVISGNSAHTHGGGIMTNGGLILGRKETVITATPSLDISGTKQLLKDGVAQSGGLNFEFQLKNSNDEVVGTATADSSTGAFTISPNTKYEKAGNYTYYLTEVNDGRSGVTYDGSQYRIDVTIAEKSVTLVGVTFKSYYVDTVNVTKSGSGDSSSGDSSSGGSSGGDSSSGGSETSNTFKIHYQNGNNWSQVYLHIWGSTGLTNDTEWPGMKVEEDPNNSGWYTQEFTVTGSGNFKYIFNNGNSGDGNQTGDCSGSYAPGTELWVDKDGSITNKPSGWGGGTGSSSDADFTGTQNSDGSYSLEIHGNAFTNTIQTSLNLQLTKTDSSDASTLLEGATFLLKREGAEAGTEATTGSDGIATFTGISRNATYYLYEKTPPANYMVAGPWILEVRADNTATLYPAAEQEDGSLTKTSETGTALSGSGSGPIVLSASISDQSWGYELPNTGGAGTQPYTMGGIALMAAAAMFLLYSDTKRRKEDAPSS